MRNNIMEGITPIKKINYWPILGCTECGVGYMDRKSGRYGIFYGCSEYADGCKKTLTVGGYDYLMNEAKLYNLTKCGTGIARV